MGFEKPGPPRRNAPRGKALATRRPSSSSSRTARRFTSSRRTSGAKNVALLLETAVVPLLLAAAVPQTAAVVVQDAVVLSGNRPADVVAKFCFDYTPRNEDSRIEEDYSAQFSDDATNIISSKDNSIDSDSDSSRATRNSLSSPAVGKFEIFLRAHRPRHVESMSSTKVWLLLFDDQEESMLAVRDHWYSSDDETTRDCSAKGERARWARQVPLAQLVNTAARNVVPDDRLLLSRTGTTSGTTNTARRRHDAYVVRYDVELEEHVRPRWWFAALCVEGLFEVGADERGAVEVLVNAEELLVNENIPSFVDDEPVPLEDVDENISFNPPPPNYLKTARLSRRAESIARARHSVHVDYFIHMVNYDRSGGSRGLLAETAGLVQVDEFSHDRRHVDELVLGFLLVYFATLVAVSFVAANEQRLKMMQPSMGSSTTIIKKPSIFFQTSFFQQSLHRKPLQVHPALRLLGIAAAFAVLSSSLELFNYGEFKWNGRGRPDLHYFSKYFFELSRFVVILLLMWISEGWCSVYPRIENKKLLFFLLFLTLARASLEIASDLDFHQHRGTAPVYFEYDAPPFGWALVLCDFWLFSLFFHRVNSSILIFESCSSWGGGSTSGNSTSRGGKTSTRGENHFHHHGSSALRCADLCSVSGLEALVEEFWEGFLALLEEEGDTSSTFRSGWGRNNINSNGWNSSSYSGKSGKFSESLRKVFGPIFCGNYSKNFFHRAKPLVFCFAGVFRWLFMARFAISFFDTDHDVEREFSSRGSVSRGLFSNQKQLRRRSDEEEDDASTRAATSKTTSEGNFSSSSEDDSSSRKEIQISSRSFLKMPVEETPQNFPQNAERGGMNSYSSSDSRSAAPPSSAREEDIHINSLSSSSSDKMFRRRSKLAKFNATYGRALGLYLLATPMAAFLGLLLDPWVRYYFVYFFQNLAHAAVILLFLCGLWPELEDKKSEEDGNLKLPSSQRGGNKPRLSSLLRGGGFAEAEERNSTLELTSFATAETTGFGSNGFGTTTYGGGNII